MKTASARRKEKTTDGRKKTSLDEVKLMSRVSSISDQDEWSNPRGDDERLSGMPKNLSPSPSQERSVLEGVVIPSLLADFFGLDFLPLKSTIINMDEDEYFSDQVDGDMRMKTKNDELISVKLEAGNSPSAQEEGSIVVEENYLEEESPRKRKQKGQRMKKAYGMFKNVKNVVQEAKDRRQLRRQDRNPDDSENVEEAAHSPSKEIQAGVQTLESSLERHKLDLYAVQLEAITIQNRVEDIVRRVRESQREIEKLEHALHCSVLRLEKNVMELNETKKELNALNTRRDETTKELNETSRMVRKSLQMRGENGSVDIPSTPKRRNSRSDDVLGATKNCNHGLDSGSCIKKPNSLDVDTLKKREIVRSKSMSLPLPDIKIELKRVNSSFIRVHDLDLSTYSETPDSVSDSSSLTPEPKRTPKDEFFSFDQDVGAVLEALVKFGYDVIVDESDRFQPVLNTDRLLAKTAGKDPSPPWSIRPWHLASGTDVLVWQGSSHHHGPGKDLPVMKARGIVPATPELVLELLWDSNRVGEYNKMSQGRHDLLYLQKGVNTTADESYLGVAGEAKIIRALNKPPVIRRNIEMTTLVYARPLEENFGPHKGYVSVSRSVWEDETGTASGLKDTIRSEMLLGVNLLRPLEAPDGECHCELTTVTHVHTSAVPEMLARRMAPAHAVGYIREIQAVFSRGRPSR